MAYRIEGRLLEVCTCNTLCPCWIGEDPDSGTCDSVLAWHVDSGKVGDVDITGRTLALLVHIPGNVLKGNWKARAYIDQGATPQQKDAILQVWSGKMGGAIADFAALIGEIVSVEQVPIRFDVQGVTGRISVGPGIEAEMAAYQGATGRQTALHDTVFSSIPGSPAFVGKASRFRAQAPGWNVDIRDHNAICGAFRFEA